MRKRCYRSTKPRRPILAPLVIIKDQGGITLIKACGLGQFCCFDSLNVHSAAVRPSLRATALKNSNKFTRSLFESSAVMPTSRNITWGFDLKIPLRDDLLRTRIFPGCISAWIKLSTWRKGKNNLHEKYHCLFVH